MRHAQLVVQILVALAGLVGAVSVIDDAESWAAIIESLGRWNLIPWIVVLVLAAVWLGGVRPRVERSRAATSAGDDMRLAHELETVLVGLERELRPVADFWLGVSSPAVEAGEELIYRARRAVKDEDFETFRTKRIQEVNPVQLPWHIEHQTVSRELRSGDAWRRMETIRTSSADLIDVLRSLQMRIPLDDNLSSLGAELKLLDGATTSDSFDLALLLLVAAGAERARSGDLAFPQDELIGERDFASVEEVVEASFSRPQSTANPADGTTAWATVLMALSRERDGQVLAPVVQVRDRQIAGAKSRWDAFVDGRTQRSAWLAVLAEQSSAGGRTGFWQRIAASAGDPQRRAATTRRR